VKTPELLREVAARIEQLEVVLAGPILPHTRGERTVTKLIVHAPPWLWEAAANVALMVVKEHRGNPLVGVKRGEHIWSVKQSKGGTTTVHHRLEEG
jgi:hypothetical protein